VGTKAPYEDRRVVVKVAGEVSILGGIILECIFQPDLMAKRRSRKMRKMQPAQLDLYFKTDPENNNSNLHYIDTAKELSKVNRRGYSQSKCYAYQGLTFIWKQNAENIATIECTVRTAGNTWMVHNAHVKGEALWREMQALVLADNPSIKGKWHDFKVQLWEGQSSIRTLSALDANGAEYLGGEWNLATYVMPQHDVDGAGEPLPADEFTAMLIGDDTTTKRSLLKAYQFSRATVQADMPNVPAGMSNSFFNLLTDSGSQEPELADVIIDENDNPPYDIDIYPGSSNLDGTSSNAATPVAVAYAAISSAEVDGRIGGFIAPCGLIELDIVAYGADGSEISADQMPEIEILLHCAPGMYKGVAAVPMGQ
jgi:hypothetical protein